MMIGHKTQPTNQPTSLVYLCGFQSCVSQMFLFFPVYMSLSHSLSVSLSLPLSLSLHIYIYIYIYIYMKRETDSHQEPSTLRLDS